jgi:type I restriction enzyme S subunit
MSNSGEYQVGQLNSIADVLSGFAFKSQWFKSVGDKIIRIGDIFNEQISQENCVCIDASKYKIPRYCVTQKGDILMALSGATTGKIGIVNTQDSGLYVNQRIAIIRGKNQENKKYLKYVFSGENLQKLILRAGGAAQANLSPNSLREMEIPLPSLPEQKRIASILDKADAIRRKRRHAIQLADEFLRSVFLDIFGDPASNPKGWQRKKIEQLGKVVTGNTPSRQIRENFGDHIEWIKSDNINTPSHIVTRAEEGLSEDGEKLGRTVPANSTLVTCIAGTPECIGNTALTDRKVAFNQQINAIVPFDNVDTYFLYTLVLMSKKIIQRASTNSMKGMVNKGIFQEIELISPPSILQNKFGVNFYSYLNYLDKQELQLKESDNLFNSLCQKAFRGEL